MSIAEKLATVAENVPKVYAAGQSSMVDESKIIEKTVSGAFISVDDVSEIPHKVGCRVSGVDDLTSVKVTRCGKNLIDIEPMLSATNWRKDSSLNVNGYWNYPITGLIPNADYTLSMASNGWSGVADNGLYVTLRNSVGQFAEAGALCHTTGYSYYCKSKITVKSNESGMLYLSFYNPTDERLATFFGKCPDMILELGTSATDYEPYTMTEYTPNADGTVEGMTSISPYMNVFTDNADVTLDVTYRKSWGMQTEYDRFWDSFQNTSIYPKRCGPAHFAGTGWNNDTFKPKYDIKVSNGYFLFYNCGVKGDLVEILNGLGVTLDTSEATSVQYLFWTSRFTRVGEINLTGLARVLGNTSQAFSTGTLITIDKIIINENNVFATNMFAGATALKNITVEGPIAYSISFKDCPLSKASILSLFNSLSDTITGTTLTLKLSAVNTAFETSAGAADGSTSEEWAALIATKPNWTISLV